jgi:hypothetical protein
MNNKYTLCGLALAFIAFNSCTTPKTNDNEIPVPAGMIRIDLTKSGLAATIDIPDTTKKVWGIEAGSSGSIHVFVGNGFHVLINVADEPIAMKKSDINGDDLNKPKTWVINDTNSLLYSTQKDTNAFANAKEEFHLYTIVRKDKSTFYIKDMVQGTDGSVYTFNKDQAQTMLNSAKSLTPVAPKAKSQE